MTSKPWLTLLLLLVALPATAAKPIDTRLNAVFKSSKQMVKICHEFERPIDAKAYEAAVLAAVPKVAPGAAIVVATPVKVRSAEGPETCSAHVETVLTDGTLWIRIRAPGEVDDYTDFHWRGAPGSEPKYLGSFVPYASPTCNPEAGPPDRRVLGMTQAQLRALPEPVRAFICGVTPAPTP